MKLFSAIGLMTLWATSSIGATAHLPAGAKAPLLRSAKANSDRLDRVLAGLQKRYENTKTFSAKFSQSYTNSLLKKTDKSTGQVSFQKPGQMRWDYSAPVPKSFLVANNQLWIHQHKDQLAMVNKCFKQDTLTTSISFLWGAGNLKETFQVSFFQGTIWK